VGVDLNTGGVFWRQKVPAFRGMNILTPVIVGDAVFTSSYRNNSWLYRVAGSSGQFDVETVWSNNVQGYMSAPIVVDGHAYLHLQNRRFACINLKTGERTWTSQPFGKYASLIAQGDRFLALDASGRLLLIKANSKEFELVDDQKISEDETWAHLAASGNELFVRELGAITAYRWAE
jgi:outer membrane protein assembly factor BamB